MVSALAGLSHLHPNVSRVLHHWTVSVELLVSVWLPSSIPPLPSAASVSRGVLSYQVTVCSEFPVPSALTELWTRMMQMSVGLRLESGRQSKVGLSLLPQGCNLSSGCWAQPVQPAALTRVGLLALRMWWKHSSQSLITSFYSSFFPYGFPLL